MKAPFLQLIAVPLSLLLGWFGSAFLRTDTQPSALLSNTTTQASLLGDRSAPSGPYAHLQDESASYLERLFAIAQQPALSPAAFHQRLLDLSKLPKTTLRKDALTELIEDWIRHEPTAAFAACEALGDKSYRATALQRVVWGWSVYNPEAALEHMLALPKEHPQRVGFIRDAARKVGKESPRRALDILAQEQIPPSTDFETIYTALAKEDLSDAISRLKDAKYQMPWKAVMAVWMERDQTAAIKHFATDYSIKHWDVRDVMKRLLPNMQFDKALETHDLLATHLPPESWKELQEDFAQAWFSKDPEAATTWVAEVEDDSLRDSMTRAIGVSLANKSPSEAFQYLVDQGQHGRISYATKQWAEQDWDAAYEQVRTFEGSPKAKAVAASGLLSSSSSEMTTEHIHELLSYTEAQREPPYLRELLPKLSAQDIGNLLETYPASIAPAMKEYLTQLVEHDPKGAAALASRLPANEERDRNIAQITAQWAANDPSGAATWLATLPEGESRTSAYRTYMNALTRTYPEEANQWLENVPDDVKQQTIQEFVGVTVSHDPETTLAALLKHTPNNHALIRRAMEQLHRLHPEQALARLPEFDGDLRKEIKKRFDLNDAWRVLGNPR